MLHELDGLGQCYAEGPPASAVPGPKTAVQCGFGRRWPHRGIRKRSIHSWEHRDKGQEPMKPHRTNSQQQEENEEDDDHHSGSIRWVMKPNGSGSIRHEFPGAPA